MRRWNQPAPVVTLTAIPCRCGGKLDTRYHEAFSTDSSFDYVGCDTCDIAFVNEDEITDAVITRWNALMC